ncbi:MAG: LysM peptidoglycan-binding domain-containing protein [Clostridia bacterium]
MTIELKQREFFRIWEGDTFLTVAEMYGCSISYIKRANANLQLENGNVLYVPKQDVYIVKIGDSVKSVCQKFGISKQKLFKINGCKNVFNGQMLKVK